MPDIEVKGDCLLEFPWWDTKVKYITQFCTSRRTCQRSKSPNVPVPLKPREAIEVIFTGSLPDSKDRKKISIRCNRPTNVHDHSPTNYTAKEIAELVFAEVYRYHRLPRAVISDRDILFASLFRTHLKGLIGIKRKISSTYHPETYGATGGQPNDRADAKMLYRPFETKEIGCRDYCSC